MINIDMRKISFELWVDDPKRIVLTKDYFFKLHDLHVDAIAVMIDPMSQAWDVSWTKNDITKLSDLAHKDNIEIVLTVWTYPNKKQIDQVIQGLFDLLSAGVISGIECDLEANWKKRHLVGFPTMREAANYLISRLNYLKKYFQIRREVTTFANHVENNHRAVVAPYVDRLCVQAYSIRYRNKKFIEWEHLYGPGSMQRYTINKTLTIPGVKSGNPELCVGLAGWSQRWPGHTVSEALAKALNVALLYQPVAIRYFSSKHIIGIQSKNNIHIYHFLYRIRHLRYGSIDLS